MRAILVHGLDDALAAAAVAAETGVPLRLVTAPGAGLHAGPGWFLALVEAVRSAHPGLDLAAALDCDDAPGGVLAALRAGVRQVVFVGDPDTAARLAAIAAQSGATLTTERPCALDLAGLRDKRDACRRWLAETA